MHMWLSWLRRQVHKLYDAGSSLVRTIKIGLNIILKDILYNFVSINYQISLKSWMS